jgi:hypothetical protein
MGQSTKLFLVLGFMFVLYTTMNGHLEKYLRVVFGSSGSRVDTSSGSLDFSTGDSAVSAASALQSLGL